MKKTTAVMTESDVNKAFRKLFKLDGKFLKLSKYNTNKLVLYRNNTGTRGGISFGVRGAGDYMGCCNGYPMAIELKRDIYTKLSREQTSFAKAWVGAGGVYLKVGFESGNLRCLVIDPQFDPYSDPSVVPDDPADVLTVLQSFLGEE